jgi:hypothetical protein
MTDGGEGRNEDVRFEKDDVSPKALARFMLILVVATLVVAYVVRALYFSLGAREARHQPPPPIMQFEANREFPIPKLEDHPVDDLAAYRAKQERVTATYGWVDKPGGIVRIPIDEAMRLLLERGLPVAPSESPQPKVAK